VGVFFENAQVDFEYPGPAMAYRPHLAAGCRSFNSSVILSDDIHAVLLPLSSPYDYLAYLYKATLDVY